MITVQVRTGDCQQMVDVTAHVREVVAQAKCSSGAVICFVPHTTAAITINENADPDVTRDILHKLAQEIPQQDGYHHAEGNSDAHVKASLVGSSVTVLVDSGQLVLGTWQGIYFCEFDGPRARSLHIKVIPDD